MLSMFFFNAKESPAIFYALSGLTQFFFSGFNTAIYAIIPDCVEYGEWKTGLRNDGFQYAFISLGNKIGMAVGTALLAGLLGSLQSPITNLARVLNQIAEKGGAADAAADAAPAEEAPAAE